MPYRCARAVCATFCFRIAGALIPLFGPSFPSLCTPLDSPRYKDMVIDPRTIAETTEDVERFRYGQKNRATKAVDGIGSSFRLESYALRSKQESQASSAPRLPPRSQSYWTPINASGVSHRPMAVSAPSTSYENRDTNSLSRVSRSAVASRSAPERNPFQMSSSFFNGPAQTGTVEAGSDMIEKWRLKRRRRARDEPKTTYSAIPSSRADAWRRPQQELEHFKAAAALVSLQGGIQDAEFSSALVVESSDDDFQERRHQKKRPKAHSF